MFSDQFSGFSSAFDEMLKRNSRELDALSNRLGSPALSPASRTSANLSAGSSAAGSQQGVAQGVSTRATTSPSALRSLAECALDEGLGPGWRYEVLDRAREGDELLVRCRVTAPSRGVSRTWHGSAALSGAGGGGTSGVSGTAGSVRFALGTGAARHDPIRAEREAERQAIESALAACARLL